MENILEVHTNQLINMVELIEEGKMTIRGRERSFWISIAIVSRRESWFLLEQDI